MKKRLCVLILMITVMAIPIMGCGTGNTATDQSTSDTDQIIDTTDTTETIETNDQNKASNTQTTDVTNLNSANLITEAEAFEIALTHSGVVESDVVSSYIKLDTDDGIKEYDVEFRTADKEYDYEINATDRSILGFDYEVENNLATNNNSTTGQATVLSEDEAKAIALAKVAGATDSNIQLRLETDDGVQVYEGSIVYNNIKYEFEIDAVSGTIYDWEEESVFDD